MSAHCKCGATWSTKARHCMQCHETFADHRHFVLHARSRATGCFDPAAMGWEQNKHGQWHRPLVAGDEQGALL